MNSASSSESERRFLLEAGAPPPKEENPGRLAPDPMQSDATPQTSATDAFEETRRSRTAHLFRHALRTGQFNPLLHLVARDAGGEPQ
jgi:hypothetical protein